MIVTFGKLNGKPVKVDVIDAIFRSGRTIAKPRPKKAVRSPLMQYSKIMDEDHVHGIHQWRR